MEISFQIAWRRDYTWFSEKCDEDTIQSNGVVDGSNNGELLCYKGCLEEKTGLSMAFYCTDFSITENWSFGGRSMKFNFTGPGNQVTIAFEGSNWIAPFSAKWYVAVSNNITKRNDTGKVNSTPRSITSPIVKLKEFCNHTLSLSVSDPDNDIVKCRWGEGYEECGGVCNEFPNAVLHNDTCTITYEAKYGTGFRIAAVMIEDFLPDSDIPLSSVSLQFVVEVYSTDEGCDRLPYFIPPTFTPGSCIAIPPNRNFFTKLIAKSGRTNATINEIVTVSPAGFRKSPVQYSSQFDAFYVNISWQPEEEQLNKTHSFCYTAVNSLGDAGDQNCILLMAGSYPPSIVNLSVKRKNLVKYQIGLEFDRPIQSASNRAEIIFTDYETNIVLYRINMMDSTELSFPDLLHLTIFPNFTFPERKKLFMELDRNIVTGHEGCHPGNEEVGEKEILTFMTDDITPPRATFITPSRTSGNVTFTWTLSEPAQGICSLDLHEFVNCSENFTVYNLAEGNHMLFIQLTDQGNNTGNTTHVFYVDLTPPVTTFSTFPSVISNEASFTFTFSCDEPANDCTFYCEFNTSLTTSTNYSLCSGHSYATPLLENEHEYTLTVFSVDPVGNIGNSIYFSWVVDLKPPVIVINDTDVECSDYHEIPSEDVVVTDNVDPYPVVTFTDSNDDCVTTRTWEATDEAGNTAVVEQKITILFDLSILLLPSVTFPCSSASNDSAILPVETASAPNACERPLVMLHEDYPSPPLCPGHVSRTWTLSDTCTGKEVKAHQTIHFYDACPVYACGRNYSEPHGICSQGSCVCNYPWQGDFCNIQIYKPTIAPVELQTLLEYQDIVVSLTLLEGTEPVTWSILSAPAKTQFEYSTQRLLLQNAPAGNLSFKILAKNLVGEDEVVIKAVVSKTYIIAFNPLNKTQFINGDIIVLSGNVSHHNVSPIRESLGGKVPVLIEIRNTGSESKRIFNLITDQSGQFSALLSASSLEYGRSEALARRPSGTNTESRVKWEVLGMKTSSRFISLRGETNGPYRAHYQNATFLINDGPADLHKIEADLVYPIFTDYGTSINVTFGQGEKTVNILTTGREITLHIDLRTSGPAQMKFPVILQSEEGVKISFKVDINIKQILPVIHVDPPVFETTIIQGSQKSMEFVVSNLGKTSAEDMKVALPSTSFLAVSSFGTNRDAENAFTLDSQEAAKLLLLITVPGDQPLGIISGRFYILSKTTNTKVAFSIQVTSDNLMNLTVVVEDEYTYFAEENPLVSGASIILINKRQDLELQSTTSTDGSAVFLNIREDVYEIFVEAPGHRELKKTVVTSLSNPTLTVFLEREAVKFRWSVVQTEIKDVYDITLEADFKVNVPMPIVTLTPTAIDLEDYILGLRNTIEFTVTNHGLIRADGIHMKMPSDHPSLKFSYLSEVPESLEAKQSLSVMILVSRTHIQKRPMQCRVYHITLEYTFICGDIQVRNVISMLKERTPYSSCFAPLSGKGNGGNARAFPALYSHDYSSDTFNFCNKCLWAAFTCIPFEGSLKYVMMAIGYYQCVQRFSEDNMNLNDLSKALIFIGCTPELILPPYITCIDDVLKECFSVKLPEGHPLKPRSISNKEVSQDIVIERLGHFALSTTGLLYSIHSLEEIFGDRLWLEKGNASWVNQVLRPVFEDSSELGNFVSLNEFNFVKDNELPEGITWEDTEKLLNRFNTTLSNWQKGNLEPEADDNMISYSFVEESVNNLSMINKMSQERGFNSIIEAHKYDTDKLLEIESTEQDDGICAIVRIQVKHTAMLTREGFLAKIEIENKEKRTMQNIKVDIVFSEKETSLFAAEKFAIGKPSLTGFLTGTDGNGTLPKGSAGASEWLIIPYSEAAPTSPVRYDIGGKLSYMANGNKIDLPFVPTMITVFPDPSLIVHYFWEKNVISDDPFTEEIEPAVPFSLGVMIKNEGFGTAYSMKITSSQPEIIENEKGLLISFKMVSSVLGNEKMPPSLAVDFEDIPPNVTKTARWWMTSSLMGKFINYNATFENKNPLGDPKLSLIDDLQIHELIQNVLLPGDDDILDFLVNDDDDVYSLPDKIYSSRDMSYVNVTLGEVSGMSVQENEEIIQVQVDTQTNETGWNYFVIEDPRLVSFPTGSSQGFSIKRDRMIRSSLEMLPSENAWISMDVINRDRKKSLNILAYSDSGSQRSYLVDICGNCTSINFPVKTTPKPNSLETTTYSSSHGTTTPTENSAEQINTPTTIILTTSIVIMIVPSLLLPK